MLNKDIKKENTTNLSKQRREEMLEVLESIKEQLKVIPNAKQSDIEGIAKIEEQLTKNRYGLIWEEHEEEVDSQLKTKLPVFIEDMGREIKELENEKVNFILEGDNLHSLKLLEKTHRNKIDVIYIDPPYNTGKKDFKYGDRMVDELDDFRHSKWLSFMAKRLEVARELLTIEGVVFISIDENEQAALKMLCDDIFGINNFISSFVWQKKSGGGQAKYFYEGHEYVLIYSKSKSNLKEGLTLKNEKPISKSKQIMIDGIAYGYEDDYIRKKFGKYEKGTERRLHYEDIIEYKGIKKKEQVDKEIKDKKAILIEDEKSGKHFVAKLIPLNKERRKKMYSILTGYWTSDGNTEIGDLGFVFDNPKPVNMLKLLIDSTNKKNAIILDFFAGSGTTGQAVLELNKEDGGNRTFILCTNNEVGEDKEKEFKKTYGDKEDNLKEWEEWEEQYGIARSITYQRMKKVIEGYTTPKGKEIEGLPANMKYYKTGYVPLENPKDEDYEVEDEILKHIIELIQLENHINIDNKKVGLVLSDLDTEKEECVYNIRHITENKHRLKEINTIYISEGLIMPDGFYRELEERNIQVYTIPRYYMK